MTTPNDIRRAAENHNEFVDEDADYDLYHEVINDETFGVIAYTIDQLTTQLNYHAVREELSDPIVDSLEVTVENLKATLQARAEQIAGREFYPENSEETDYESIFDPVTEAEKVYREKMDQLFGDSEPDEVFEGDFDFKPYGIPMDDDRFERLVQAQERQAEELTNIRESSDFIASSLDDLANDINQIARLQ